MGGWVPAVVGGKKKSRRVFPPPSLFFCPATNTPPPSFFPFLSQEFVNRCPVFPLAAYKRKDKSGEIVFGRLHSTWVFSVFHPVPLFGNEDRFNGITISVTTPVARAVYTATIILDIGKQTVLRFKKWTDLFNLMRYARVGVYDPCVLVPYPNVALQPVGERGATRDQRGFTLLMLRPPGYTWPTQDGRLLAAVKDAGHKAWFEWLVGTLHPPPESVALLAINGCKDSNERSERYALVGFRFNLGQLDDFDLYGTLPGQPPIPARYRGEQNASMAMRRYGDIRRDVPIDYENVDTLPMMNWIRGYCRVRTGDLAALVHAPAVEGLTGRLSFVMVPLVRKLFTFHEVNSIRKSLRTRKDKIRAEIEAPKG